MSTHTNKIVFLHSLYSEFKPFMEDSLISTEFTSTSVTLGLQTWYLIKCYSEIKDIKAKSNVRASTEVHKKHLQSTFKSLVSVHSQHFVLKSSFYLVCHKKVVILMLLWSCT